ncbi:phenylalanine--tRNA ligase subunit beta [Flavobacterium sp. CS20]|uniref:phenylalanine--tRNA ligase subunit beta n=1 Tax=Flavobacterium sp. CS20 TaxID=2775246 RepID=UPI001B39F13F|nr:phenylalanine--tRNA ligase subunit beta [Flavobacterium sp. CS20]QTY26880.1 phenylalanine--tRNA ligase subunit beta [Flavobacterium sp. CS20]
MKISYNWLKDFIDIKWSAEKIETILTDLGLEVEGIENFESIKGQLEGLVVGKVLECKKHPNADRLKLTQVDIGEKDPVQIVCGAPNVNKNQWVPVATVGTTIYNQKGESLKIKKGKIRGEVSMGMICAEDEIGLGKSHDGIMVLEGDFQPGQALNTVFPVETDKVFEIGLTPNRADAMSHWGVARDLRAGIMHQGKSLPINTPSISNFHVEDRSRRTKIEVKNSELAPRYCGITITDINIDVSPLWLQNRLKAIGINPKNNIVDITNYVMHEIGQPLHAFDADKIKDSQIMVKTLDEGSLFTTLDGVERKLSSEDLMICDTEKPLCIAGVLGGENSGVSETTKSIFLESAYFNSVSVRKTAKRHGINTDASFRFERGIDPHITEDALKRATILISEIAGGKISSEIDDFYPKKIEDHQVFLTFDKINSLVGEELDSGVIKSILTSLDIKVNNVSESGMGLTIPAYRVDVTREVDVIEEILRVYGYNKIKLDNKFNVSVANSSKFEDYKIQNIIANMLVSKGFYETMANSLTTSDYTEFSSQISKRNNVEIINPLSQDLAVMRQSLLFSGLENISYNLNRKNENLKFFEFGKSYHKFDKKIAEQKHLSLFVVGNRVEENWLKSSNHIDFFYLKGIVESVLEKLGLNFISAPNEDDTIAEGLSYKVKTKTLVKFGRLKKEITEAFDVSKEVLYADFDWDTLLNLTAKIKFKSQDIPKYPEVRRDFALLIDENISFEQIENIAKKTDKKLLQQVNLFDVYQGENLPDDKKSYAVSFTFRDQNKTLTDKQVDKIMAKLQKQFETQLQAELR